MVAPCFSMLTHEFLAEDVKTESADLPTSVDFAYSASTANCDGCTPHGNPTPDDGSGGGHAGRGGGAPGDGGLNPMPADL
mmetsp:Transcript_32811/g.85891  ORF Transcript_32811/g.85891 Transcript_32811/m.85891 type:complete len:80 (+) Transcript_32811:460-699(+)